MYDIFRNFHFVKTYQHEMTDYIIIAFGSSEQSDSAFTVSQQGYGRGRIRGCTFLPP